LLFFGWPLRHAEYLLSCRYGDFHIEIFGFSPFSSLPPPFLRFASSTTIGFRHCFSAIFFEERREMPVLRRG